MPTPVDAKPELEPLYPDATLAIEAPNDAVSSGLANELHAVTEPLGSERDSLAFTPKSIDRLPETAEGYDQPVGRRPDRATVQRIEYQAFSIPERIGVVDAYDDSDEPVAVVHENDNDEASDSHTSDSGTSSQDNGLVHTTTETNPEADAGSSSAPPEGGDTGGSGGSGDKGGSGSEGTDAGDPDDGGGDDEHHETAQDPPTGERAHVREAGDVNGSDQSDNNAAEGGPKFYTAREVCETLELAPRTLLDMTRSGLVLAMRVEGGEEARNQRYVAPYVDAIRRQMDATGESGAEVFRNVAFQSGGQVDAMIEAFTNEVEERAQGGSLTKTDLLEVFGWRTYDTVRSHNFSERATAAEVLGRVAWQHIILDEVKLLTAGDVYLNELDVSRTMFSADTRQGRVLAQRVLAYHGVRGGSDYRYPELAIKFEREYADSRGLDHIAGVRAVDKAKSRPRNRLDRQIHAQFGASVFRASDPEGYIPNHEAARLVAVNENTMRTYELNDGDRGIQRSRLLEHVIWSRQMPTEPPLEQGIFDRRFNRQWHYLER